jgi:signal transduction histidine kinase
MASTDDRIRILIVEDSELDAELISGLLDEDGINAVTRRVDDEPSYLAAIEDFDPDIIISDLSMPTFSGYRALELARTHAAGIPFMFVSGTMGEEAAVEAVRKGATDYVLKHSMARLAASVRRALREAEERKARREAEQSLLRAQRYEALALLASGLSHDLRNVLQPISMSASMLMDDGDEKLKKIGHLLQTCTQRGLDIVTSMLTFARGARSATEMVRVSALLEGLRILLRGSVSKDVDLVIRPPPEDVDIEGNYTELQQCLLNLSLNALQAMPEGGTLTLGARSHDLDDAFFEAGESARPGTYLRIEVCDNGIGMSEEVRSNLFRAFFTTKKNGTGLGLLSCRRIVEDHEGYLRIESEPGEGTTFTLYIPLRRARAPKTEAEPPLGRGQRILIVSEAEGVLSMMSDILRNHAYAVSPVQSGVAAIQEIDSTGLPALVLMEAEMNLMTGVKTLAALLERAYRGPVVMMVDAGAGAPINDELPPIENLHLIEKPVNATALLRVVADALDREGSD